MTFLKDLTLAVCVLSAIHTVLMMLAPDRYRQELRTVVALAAAVTVCGFMLRADLSELSFGISELDPDSVSDQRNSLVQRELENKIEQYISSFLEESGTECKKVSVRTTIDGQSCIFITEVEITLDPDGIDIQHVKEAVREKIGDVDVKIISGES